jgi:hypothetical protein
MSARWTDRQAMLDCDVTPTAIADMLKMLWQRDVLLERRHALLTNFETT